MNFKIIGLTGPSGAGKSTVSCLLSQFGIITIDADKTYDKLLVPPSVCLDELAAYFGNGILNIDMTLNRKILAETVFDKHNTEKLEMLNRITHKHILCEARRLIKIYKEHGVPAVLFDAPLLFESEFEKDCDIIISVLASHEIRLKRIMERDGIDEISAKQRLSVQKDDNYYIARSDYIIYNNGSLSEIKNQIDSIINKII